MRSLPYAHLKARPLGTRTVPPWKAPDPRKVIPFVRIWTLWWYTPGLTNTVSPGLAALIAA
jgi:hypothetical protein